MHAVHFWDEREVYLFDERPGTEKESMQEGKRSIGHRMKYVHENLNSFCPHTNERVCFSPLAYNNLGHDVILCAVRKHRERVVKVM